MVKRNKLIVIALLLILSLLLIGCTQSGGDNNSRQASLEGNIYDSKTKALVTGSAAVSYGVKNISTSDGKYMITGLAAGTKELVVNVAGYQEYKKLVPIEDGKNQHDVELVELVDSTDPDPEPNPDPDPEPNPDPDPDPDPKPDPEPEPDSDIEWEFYIEQPSMETRLFLKDIPGFDLEKHKVTNEEFYGTTEENFLTDFGKYVYVELRYMGSPGFSFDDPHPVYVSEEHQYSWDAPNSPDGKIMYDASVDLIRFNFATPGRRFYKLVKYKNPVNRQNAPY